MKNKDKKKKSHVPIRMNMLFFIVFLLFAILILRLGVIQIVYGDDAKREIERTDDVTVSTSTPRGLIYDKNLKLLVDNKPRKAITYTPAKTPNQKETLETAEALAKIIKQDTDKITERDKIDFWILKNPKEAEAKITKEEKEKYEGKENESEMYKLQRERVTEEELASLSQEDLEVLAIYREFTSGYALVPQIVKNDNVTKEELAFVSEHLSLLPGVDTTTDWERQYVFKDTLRSILGGITSGLPAENIDYYLSRGYSRNDRVGKSYLELQYEDVLRGQKEKVKNVTRSGNVLETVLLQEGMRGKDLVLTIDIELQQAVDKIIEEALINTKRKGGTGLLDRAFVVMMDPNTGEILSLSGKQYLYNEEKGKYEFTDFAAGNFTTSYVVGSSVKGATVLTGYMTGAIDPYNSTKLDEPLHIKDTPVKSSWFNRYGARYLNDKQALAMSSNVYMFKTAIAIGGGQYRRNQPLGIDKEKAFSEMRNHFGQLGLGVRTGIDLPGEQIGYQGNVETAESGKVLDFSIGQFDTFTPLQLAQYVSTIANGGYRMQPQIVKEIREPGDKDGAIGPLAQAMEPKVLNKVEASKDLVKRVQDGFWDVFNASNGTGAGTFRGKPYQAAGKTGTAETREKGTDVWNLTLVAYAPFKNPEVAISVVVPSAYVDGANDNKVNSIIGDKVLQTYFDLKANRGKEDKNEDNVED